MIARRAGATVAPVSLAVVLILLVAGAVNTVPIFGVTGSAALGTLYGVPFTDPDLLVLMRHRAVLLGLLGASLIVAAFVPSWRLPAIIANVASMLVFVALALLTAATNAQTARTTVIDVVTTVALLVALVLHLMTA